MPHVTSFEWRRFGAALVFSIAALVSRVAVSQAAEADAPAAPTDAATPKATKEDRAAPEADKAGDAASKEDAATPKARKAADAKADKADAEPKAGNAGDTKTTEAKDEEPGLLTILEARDEAVREGRRNGARSKAADGTLIVWDNVNSVWVAPQPKNTYWVTDRFYQFNEGIWTTSKTIAGPWEMTSQRFVPEAPRGRHIVPKDSVTATLPSGVEAVYEPRIKVFKVAGRKGVFLNDGVFYHYDGGVWLESKSADGPWTTTSSSALPGSLRRALPPAEKGAKVTLPTGDVLVSEGEPNLFAVEGKPDVVYFDGKYYERRDSKWLVSMKSDGGWEEVSSQKIPGMVRSNYHKSDDDKPKKKSGDKNSEEKKPQNKKKDGANAGAKKAAKASAGESESE
jgi:hypothetical protein